MDKLPPAKFVLPSPKFNKTINESENLPHYLTPCGMTLLPRDKQPPPMYGARGATVPPKYLQEQQVPPDIKSPNQRTENDSMPKYCESCEMELANAQDMRRHLQQHERCPVADCQFEAQTSALDKHIEALHVTGMYKEVKKLSTPEEIAAWREERKKRYPTVANVEMCKLAREQRQRRGERLDGNKSRFGKPEDRKRAKESCNATQNQRGRKRIRRDKKSENDANKQQQKQPVVANKEKEKEVAKEKPKKDVNILVKKNECEILDDSCVGGVHMFRGTSDMCDYKHWKCKKNIVTNKLIGLLGMYGSDNDEDYSEENESDNSAVNNNDEVHVKNINSTENMHTNTASADLDEAKNDTKQSEQLKTEILNESFVQEASSVKLPNASIVCSSTTNLIQPNMQTNNNLETKLDNGTSDDEAPDEAPIERIVETFPTQTVQCENQSSDGAPITQNETTKKMNTETKSTTSQAVETDKVKVKPNQAKSLQPFRRKTGLDYRKVRLRKQNTMLEKLLEADIRHERNVLLQCVRFVCENNYFGIGQTTSSTSKD